MTAADDVLQCTVEVPDAETADRMRLMLEDHLNRFAFSEGPLTFGWGEDKKSRFTDR